jgi:SET domain-containing protein
MPKQNRRTQKSRTQPRSSKSTRTSSTRTSQKKSVRKARRPARKKAVSLAASPLVEARNSAIHGRGVYAIAPIKKGTRVLEYLGERISHGEADSRYEKKGDDDGHTFLFIASNRTVIDAGVDGNDARFINHSCNPNCETVIENSRVFIDAIRNIKPGEELGYDYQLTWESTDDPAELALYACRCGAKKCRGTMLDKQPTDQRELDKKKAKKKARK